MDEDGEVELYLLLFPVSPLVLSQIKSSLWAFAYLSSSLMFARGSTIVADCDAVEEAPPPPPQLPACNHQALLHSVKHL